MSYLETIKKLFAHVNGNSEIPEEDKEKAKELLRQLSGLLAIY